MRAGAAQGLRVWLAYGVVEYFVTTIVDGVYLPRYIFPSSHWRLTILLFGIYAGVGLVVGTATGLAIHLASHKFSWLRNAGSEILLRSAVLFSLVIAFCANITYQLSTSGLTAFALAMCLTLTLAAALSVRSTVWDSRLGFITNPWTASFLLVGPLWMIKSPLRLETRQPKLLAAMATAAVILLASIVIHRLRNKKRRVAKSSAATQSRASTLLRLALVLLVLVATPFVDQRFLTKSLQINSFSRVAESPNVIWIVLDTVTAGHMSVYGYNRDTTPNLRKLSEQATVYLNAIAPSDFSLPSYASMLTGLYPSQHGAHYFPDSPWGRPLAEGFRTLPEILASKGYSTICVAANYPFFDPSFNLIQGFQHHEAWSGMIRLFGCDYCVQAALREPVIRIVPTADLDNRTLAAGNMNRRLFRLLDEVKSQDRQFFLFVNYMDAHKPYVPPPPFDTRYPGKDESSVRQHSELRNNVLKMEQGVTQRQRRHLISQYDGAIAYLDFHLGKLLARLKELDLYDNCLLIVTADHGEAFGERNLLGHTVSVYQDQVHVPLVIKYSGIRRKVVVKDFVSLVDLMPTVLDVLDYEVPAGVQGQSLLKLKPGNRREVISESFSSGRVRALHPRFRRVERAIFLGPLKLISSTNGKRELYDLSKDPHERRNLYSSGDPLSQRLEERLAKWMNSVRSPAGRPAELDRETLDRLKSLGYVQ